MGIEGGRSSARSISMPSTGATRAGGLGPHGPHKPESGGQNPGPQPTPTVVLVWRHEDAGHRLRARSWHRTLVDRLLMKRPVTVSHERTLCGIELPEHVVIEIEVDGEVDCLGCLAGSGGASMRSSRIARGEVVAA